MPNFKPKNQKVIKTSSVNNITLDTKHNDILNRFKRESCETIPNNEKEIERLKTLLKGKLNLKDKFETIDKSAHFSFLENTKEVADIIKS